MGLMGRPASSLPAGGGLWLPASNGIHMMFMRFPIDAVFVSQGRSADGSREVRSVHRGLRAWTGLVPLVRGADGVLELPVGTIDATGTAGGRPRGGPRATLRRARPRCVARRFRGAVTARSSR